MLRFSHQIIGISKFFKQKPFLLVLLPAIVLHLILSCLSVEYLISELFLVDDAFYSMKIARNIAAGLGTTFDGIHPTNGFQPLWVWLLVPVYWFEPDNLYGPVKASVVILSIFNLAAGYVLYRLVLSITKLHAAALVSAAVWLINPYFVKRVINGLESPIAILFLLAVLFMWVVSLDYGKTRQGKLKWAIFGVLIGLSMLSRVDSIFLVGTCFIVGLILQRIPMEYLRGWLIAGVVAGIVLIPWLVFSFDGFGTPIPTSGGAVRHWISFRSGGDGSEILFFSEEVISRSILSVTMLASIWAQTGLSLSLGAISILVILVLLIVIVAFVRPFRSAVLALYQDNPGLHLISFIFSLIIFLFYTFYLPAHWYFERYFLAIYIIYALYIGLSYRFFWLQLAQSLGKKFNRRIMLLTTIPLLLFAVYIPAWLPGHQEDGFYRAGIWINENLPQDAIVGSYLAGTVGYFSERKLVDLDGKVNRNAAEALIEANIGNYIRENGINFVSDWPSYIKALESRGGLNIDQDLESPVYKDSSHHDYSIYQLKTND
ncbi:MAG: hypothetical protein CL904_04905 [Dehalococcoidia bacterium]|nr:hypothetical protein [Dehalococcoidia bacterium]MQG15956.1 hypothetical protein [SAR202 cluster bacterium]|tara:strand:+ start:7566 stop:9197 length:1632 start_codon:yes stop_codon:yes gene_type:complete